MPDEKVYPSYMAGLGIFFPREAFINVVEKKWGTEYWLSNTAKFCCKLLMVNPGFQCSLHFHAEKTEEFVLLRGDVILETPVAAFIMKPGDRQLIHPGEEHRFSSEKGATILEVSTHHSDEDSYRLTESGQINDKLGTEGVLPSLQ